MLYLSFRILNEKYAVPVMDVNESVQFSKVTKVPKMPDYVLGVMNLRGKIIPVYDTRVRMGLESIYEERKHLIEMMKQREREHKAWIDQLEREVNEGIPISVQRDPHMCEFGRWYHPYMEKLKESYQRNGSGNNVLFGILKKFEKPHNEIHALAERVEEMIERGEKEQAISLIRHTHDAILHELIQHFESFYKALEDLVHRDIVIIINRFDTLFGITVDSIDSTIEINEYSEDSLTSEVVNAMSIVNNETIQILDLETFNHQNISSHIHTQELETV